MLNGLQNINNILKGKSRKVQLLFLLDGIVINGAYVLTMGIVLSGYAIYLGAGDFLTALLNNCANYATIFSIFSFILFERSSKRKELLLVLNLVSRSLMFLIAFIPLIFHKQQVSLIFIMCLVVLSEVIWGIYRVGWSVWMVTSIPNESKSEFIYLRSFFIRMFVSVMTLIAGVILDIFNKSYIGFLVVFSISFLLSLLDVFILKNVEKTGAIGAKSEKVTLKAFLQPILHIEFRKFLVFIFLFYLCLTMAASFTPIYLIRYLKLDYIFISIINVISQVFMIASSLFWGRVEKEKGFKFVLCVSGFFTIGELLILSFLTKSTWPILFFSSIIAGIGTGGFAIATFTYRYEIMPENGKTVFEGWFYFAFGLGMLIAPFAGKVLIDVIPVISHTIFASSKMQSLYLLSFTLLCILLLFTFIKPKQKQTKGQGLV